MRVNLSDIKLNSNNPRLIKDHKFKKLVQSIKDFPEMLEKRPIVVDENMTILGGNMRYQACKELGIKKINVIIAKDWTEKQKQEFIIKDNIAFGEWDWDVLANNWSVEDLNDWSLETPDLYNNDDSYYTTKIESPEYVPSKNKPDLSSLANTNKQKELIKKIEKSNLKTDVKEFLKLAANRHIVFNYGNIADYYAHSNKETQLLMEDSALVIIDFNKAISEGYVELSDKIARAYKKNGIL